MMRKNGKAWIALLTMLAAGTAAGADPPCPGSRDDIDYALQAPRLVQPLQPFSTVLARDAVIGTEADAIDLELLRIDRAVTISAPLPLRLNAGQAFGRLMIEGEVRSCVYHGTSPFHPPIDREGRQFPTICLEDHDGDGRYETVRLFAYHAAPGQGILEGRIDPVRLEPLREVPTPDFARYAIYRRLRVLSVTGNDARFVSDYAVNVPGRGGDEPTYRLLWDSEVEVALHEGDLNVGGLKLHLLHLGDSWTATPTGAFSPWIGLYCYNSRIWLLHAPEARPDKPSSSRPQ